MTSLQSSPFTFYQHNISNKQEDMLPNSDHLVGGGSLTSTCTGDSLYRNDALHWGVPDLAVGVGPLLTWGVTCSCKTQHKTVSIKQCPGWIKIKLNSLIFLKNYPLIMGFTGKRFINESHPIPIHILPSTGMYIFSFSLTFKLLLDMMRKLSLVQILYRTTFHLHFSLLIFSLSLSHF